MSSGGKSRGKKEEDGGNHDKSNSRSIEGVSSKGSSISASVELSIDEKVLVDPKSLFIGSKIGEGAHGKVYQGRFVLIVELIEFMQLLLSFECLEAYVFNYVAAKCVIM